MPFILLKYTLLETWIYEEKDVCWDKGNVLSMSVIVNEVTSFFASLTSSSNVPKFSSRLLISISNFVVMSLLMAQQFAPVSNRAYDGSD